MRSPPAPTLGMISCAFFFLLFSLLVISSAAHAQFLGQQSLSQSSYVIDKNGHLFAFGWNWAGQLGVGDKIDRNTPVEVPIPPGATRWTLVAGGTAHALAVADSDKLYAWGSNRYGQLGTGPLGQQVIPTRIPNPIGVTAWNWVTAGRDHSLALSSDGQLYAWGNNDDGQLGIGNHYMANTPQPVQALGVPAWSEVAAGPGYTLAVSTGGLLFGWGVDTVGNCFSTVPQRTSRVQYRTPTPMLALSASNERESGVLATGYYTAGMGEEQLLPLPPQPQVASDADGGFHALIIRTDGVLRSMGANEHGQLGLGNTLPYLRPHHPPNSMQVPFPPGVTQFVAVSAGLFHSLALGNDGNLYVWGDNSKGELGLGADSSLRTWPARLMTVGDPLRISATISGDTYRGSPVPVTITCTNTKSATPLRPTAMLVPCDPVQVDDSSQTKVFAPTDLPLGTTGSAQWSVEGYQYLIEQVQFYFGYIQAPGSAPYLLSGRMDVVSKPFQESITGTVLDSLTDAPLPGSIVVCIGTDTVDNEGKFREHIIVWGPGVGAGEFAGYAVRENYRTKNFNFSTPLDGDTIPEIQLGPAPVQGVFRDASDINPIDGITKLYFPDSLIGFAVGHNIIWRTTDSGSHWNAIYVSPSNNDLNDIRFANPRMGIAVGDRGEVITTTDGGDSWIDEVAGTTNNLSAVVYSDRDTAWAIGDAGTLLKRTLDTAGHAVWTVLPSFGNFPLAAIHFLDASHGAIVAYRRCITYDGSAWQSSYDTSFGDLRAVYYATPRHLYVANADGRFRDLIDSAGYKNTLSTRTIASLFFINSGVGFAAGDSSGSLVTYDGGFSWAPLAEVKGNASSLNFYGVNGHMLAAGRPMNYTGHANPVAGIVKGHLVGHDHSTGIRGAMVIRTLIRYSFQNYTWWIDTVWTNEIGNFAFAAVNDTLHYNYILYYTDSGRRKSHTWLDVGVGPGQIVTLYFADSAIMPPPPPPPPPPEKVAQSSELAFALSIDRAGGALHALFTLPRDEEAEIAIYDVMGRRVQEFPQTSYAAGDHDMMLLGTDVSNGTYFVRLKADDGELTRMFTIAR